MSAALLTILGTGIYLLAVSVVYLFVGFLLLGCCYLILGNDRFIQEVNTASEDHDISKIGVILAVVLTWPLLMYSLVKGFIGKM